jgi:type IV pilus assembly protein PilY1
VERFHALYGDESYNDYYNANLDRETVVYVGANDGMLHAFTSWEYNSATQTYVDPNPAGQHPFEEIGDEIWAYIPQSLLPHLKWLPSTSYTHIYYVDMKPKVFDAKILADGAHGGVVDGEPEWGTILLVGFNLGGYNISATGDFDYNVGTADATRNFKPSYVCMDVTDPRNPRLLWERSYDNLAMSAAPRAVVKVKDEWFAVFGSGPETCGGTSSQQGHVFVVDLATGNPYTLGASDWLFQTAEDDAFMASPVSLDKGLNYSVDAVYLGETYLDGADWEGKVYKITVPWVKSLAGAYVYDGVDIANYSDNPTDAIADKQWQFHELFDAGAPITAAPALSTDKYDNTYIYFGTGRYYNTDDKTNSDTQYLFGIKDPFFNPQWDAADDAFPGGGTAYYHNYDASLTLTTGDLFDADSYVVTTTGLVDGDLARITGWSSLLGVVRNTEDQAANPDFYDGWMRSLTTSKERILTKPAILGGILFVPSFVPNSDVCGYGGSSYLYGLYYETGTSYSEAVFTPGTETVSIGGVDYTKLSDKISLGSGKASSLGIHVGQEEGATGFIQQSTGTVLTKTLTPAFEIKSGLIYWLEE